LCVEPHQNITSTLSYFPNYLFCHIEETIFVKVGNIFDFIALWWSEIAWFGHLVLYWSDII